MFRRSSLCFKKACLDFAILARTSTSCFIVSFIHIPKYWKLLTCYNLSSPICVSIFWDSLSVTTMHLVFFWFISIDHFCRLLLFYSECCGLHVEDGLPLLHWPFLTICEARCPGNPRETLFVGKPSRGGCSWLFLNVYLLIENVRSTVRFGIEFLKLPNLR